MPQNNKVFEAVLKNLEENYRLDWMPEENTQWLRHAFEVNKAWDDHMDEFEDNEVHLARLYAREYKHGTIGHHQYMLISKLAAMLDVYESALHALIRNVESGKLD